MIRMTVNTASEMSTATAKKSSTKGIHAHWSMIGMEKLRSTSAPKASTIVSARMQKPQKAKAWARPGTVQASSLR